MSNNIIKEYEGRLILLESREEQFNLLVEYSKICDINILLPSFYGNSTLFQDQALQIIQNLGIDFSSEKFQYYCFSIFCLSFTKEKLDYLYSKGFRTNQSILSATYSSELLKFY